MTYMTLQDERAAAQNDRRAKFNLMNMVLAGGCSAFMATAATGPLAPVIAGVAGASAAAYGVAALSRKPEIATGAFAILTRNSVAEQMLKFIGQKPSSSAQPTHKRGILDRMASMLPAGSIDRQISKSSEAQVTHGSDPEVALVQFIDKSGNPVGRMRKMDMEEFAAFKRKMDTSNTLLTRTKVFDTGSETIRTLKGEPHNRGIVDGVEKTLPSREQTRNGVRKALEFKSHGEDALPAHDGRATKHYNRSQLAGHDRETGLDRIAGLPVRSELLSGAKGVILNKVKLDETSSKERGEDFSYEMSIKGENGHEVWIGSLKREEYNASLKILSNYNVDVERRHEGDTQSIAKRGQTIYDREADGPRLG